MIYDHLFVSPLYSYNEGFVDNIKSKYNNFKNRYNNDENFRKKVKIGGEIIGGLGALNVAANKVKNKYQHFKKKHKLYHNDNNLLNTINNNNNIELLNRQHLQHHNDAIRLHQMQTDLHNQAVDLHNQMFNNQMQMMGF